MNTHIVKQMVITDWRMMRPFIFCYWAGGLIAILTAILGNETLGILGFIGFVTAVAVTGIHAVMQTIAIERDEQNLAFVMSLPTTIREYTVSKMIVNLAIFGSVWGTLSIAGCVIFIGQDCMPHGTLTFTVILLLSMLVALVVILVITLVTESMGWAIASTVFANIGTQAMLWGLADLHGIRSTTGGPEPVWNAIVITIVAAQFAVLVLLLCGTVFLQYRKEDFV